VIARCVPRLARRSGRISVYTPERAALVERLFAVDFAALGYDPAQRP